MDVKWISFYLPMCKDAIQKLVIFGQLLITSIILNRTPTLSIED